MCTIRIFGRWKFLVAAASTLVFQCLPAQHLQRQIPAEGNVSTYEKKAFLSSQTFYQSSASSWLDVTYYKLQLDVSTAEGIISGVSTVVGVCKRDTAGPLVLDFVNRMTVSAASSGGARSSFSRGANTVIVNLDRVYRAGETLSVDVEYEGTPIATGFGSFIFASHAGIPWVFSLSEPAGARDWWPGKDDPSDKADSSDVIVKCDSALKVGSNGLLVSVVNNGDGTKTYHWQERYPIASYLISVALTNFAQFSNWYRYSPTDSMEILNYVLPEHLSNALATLPRTVDMLSVYSSLFGLYPFIKEKYGHAEFGSGGAMEHQTMTSTTSFAEDVISHELAHQWFGDMITCRTWADLWLNEGFAQYCSALFREKQYGASSYNDYMNAQMSLAVEAAGAIGVPDTTSVRNLFDGPRIYNKGATVLHMLRHVLGDSVFFRSLRAYANSPVLRYSTATIRDFENVCESVSGKNLAYFFQEWIYGEGFPNYGYSWTSTPTTGGYHVTVVLNQASSNVNPQFFAMPVDIQIGNAGWDTVVTVFNDSLVQDFTFNIARKPDRVTIDPDNWILKLVYSNSNEPPAEYSLSQNYPNPFNPGTTVKFRLPQRSFVTLEIFDILGRKVTTLVDEQKPAGVFAVDWNPTDVASGVYIYRLAAHPLTATSMADFVQTRKMILVK